VTGRGATYVPNNVNEYESRTVPGAFDIVGAAHPDTTVTVNGTIAQRQDGGGYYKEISARNSGAPVWLETTVSGSRSGQTSVVNGHGFVPKTPEVFNHDADGNLISDGRWTYTWNGENQIIAMETTAAAVSAGAPKQRLVFAYDYAGRRIKKTLYQGATLAFHHTLYFVYDGWNLAAEYLQTGQNIRGYVWGDDLSGGRAAGGVGGLLFIQQEPEGKQYAAGYDGNGNVTRLYDAGNSGSLAATYEYGPFGEPLRATGPMASANPFRFSTKYCDEETGLLYYGFRYYSPATGKWLSRDPLSERGGLNLTGFVFNNPLSFVDDTGQKVFPDRTNCIGHACDMGGSWQPDPLESVSDMLKKQGWKCKKVEKSADCKCDCEKESVTMIYIYLVRPANWDKLNDQQQQQYVNMMGNNYKDPFNDPLWPGVEPRLDVHGIRRNCKKPDGADDAWDYVPHDQPKNPDGSYETFPLKNPDDYWKGDTRRLLDKQCCSKAK
jgi:RHS repeat-associated protein